METSQFIGEPIRVGFEEDPLLLKKPKCPSRFEWRGVTYQILEVLAEWHTYRRRGQAEGERPGPPGEIPSQRGSWGVGKTYFRVRTGAGRVFVLYYDRTPRDVDDRGGAWLLREEILGHSPQ
ncbi:MAG: DUF6504 family protein [Anaerolineales bacterium]|jgi:hypothetical protein